MKNKIVLITTIFIAILVTYLILDYLNIMSFILMNINYSYLSIFISGLIPIYILLVTYYLVNKRISDNEKEKKRNKEKYLYNILLETYDNCKASLENYEEKITMAEKIDKKNPIGMALKYIKLEEAYIFKNDNEIIKLLNEGVANEQIMTEYIITKKLFCNIYRAKWMIDKTQGSTNEEKKLMKEVKKMTEKRIDDINEILDRAIDNIKKELEE